MVILLNDMSEFVHICQQHPSVADGGWYMAFASTTNTYELEKAGYSRYEDSYPSVDEGEGFLREYIELVDALAVDNGSRLLWWASDIASKNRVYSPLVPVLNSLYRCLRAVQAACEENKHLIFVDLPSAYIPIIEKIAPLVITVESTASSSLLVLWTRIKERWITFRELLSGLRVVIIRCREARAIFGHTPWEKCEGHPVYLIKSFSYPSSFKTKGEFDDPFFKELFFFLKKQLPEGWVVPTLTMSFDDRVPQYEKMTRLADRSVMPAETFLGFRDIFAGFFVLLSGIFHPFKTQEKLFFFGQDVTDLVRQTLVSGGSRISLLHYLYYAIGKRVALSMDVRACALTTEGNPWENMFIAGVRAVNPGTLCVGAQHAVLIKEAPGVFKGRRELANGLQPSRIVTTGEIPAEMIRKYSQFPANAIYAACALRYDYLYKDAFIDKAFDPARIEVLVVLEGLPGTEALVSYVLRESCKCPRAQFSIRAHPVLPLETVLEGLGERLCDYPNVSASIGGSVSDDVAKSDVVMYWGTTVALEALMMGKPLVHYSTGSVLSCDPLFEFSEYKWVANSATPLVEILGRVSDALLGSRKQRVDAGVEYIQRYLRPVKDEFLMPYVDGL